MWNNYINLAIYLIVCSALAYVTNVAILMYVKYLNPGYTSLGRISFLWQCLILLNNQTRTNISNSDGIQTNLSCSKKKAYFERLCTGGFWLFCILWSDDIYYSNFTCLISNWSRKLTFALDRIMFTISDSKTISDTQYCVNILTYHQHSNSLEPICN